MEKLRAALDKARSSRTGEDRPRQRSVPTVHQVGTAAWGDLRPMPSTARDLKLAAAQGGALAAPFDILRTRLSKMMQTQNWRRVAITSPTPRAGKTTLAANLAVSLMRQSENRVILMDLDMRRPGLGAMFGLPAGDFAGTADVLTGEAAFADVAYRMESNLAVVVNSKPSTGSAELLQSNRTADTLARIEAEYDPSLMIFDLPPMLSCDDAAAFMPTVDCVLLVVEAEVATVSQVDTCETELAGLTNVAGVILNKSRFDGEDSYGGY